MATTIAVDLTDAERDRLVAIVTEHRTARLADWQRAGELAGVNGCSPDNVNIRSAYAELIDVSNLWRKLQHAGMVD